ncbi:hypothetical protein Tco_1571133 [Tanacetum coccineum]
MEESLPGMVNDRIKKITKTQVPIYVAEGLILERQKLQAEIDQRVDSSVKSYMSNHILHVHPTQASQAIVHEQQYQLYLMMKDDPQLQHDDISMWLDLKIKFEILTALRHPVDPSAIAS